jgi:hypothetical protein
VREKMASRSDSGFPLPLITMTDNEEGGGGGKEERGKEEKTHQTISLSSS